MSILDNVLRRASGAGSTDNPSGASNARGERTQEAIKAGGGHVWSEYVSPRVKESIFTSLGGLVGASGGAAATSYFSPELGSLLFAVGPAVVFGAGGLAALIVRKVRRQRLRRKAMAVAALGAGTLAASLAVGAAAAGNPSDAAGAWGGMAPMVALGAAATAAVAMELAGTARRTADDGPATPKVAPVVARGRQTIQPVIVLPAERLPEAAATISRAYAIMDGPTRDTDLLVRDVDTVARDLERLARSDVPLAADARRVLAQLRARMGSELLERARKSLTAAEGALKAQRGTAHQAALRAEETARAGLAIIDPDRDAALVVKGNQFLLAAKLIQNRRDEADMLEKELDHLRAEAWRARGKERAPGHQEGFLTRVGALLALCEATGRNDLARDARALFDEVRYQSSAMDSSDRRLPGMRLDQVVLQIPGIKRVVHEMKGGGFGRTFLAVDNLDRKVVVKTLRDEWLSSASLRHAMKVESTAEGRFQHEGVPRVLQFHEVAGRPFKLMEFVPGGSLRDKINEWRQTGVPPQPARMVELVRQVVAVLVEFQRFFVGGVHRDLKPENILLDEHGNTKLTDFGLAHVPQLHVDATSFQKGTPVGTLFYMSPEQARGEAVIGPASDVYSLGVVLHELLTGIHPYGFQPDTTRSAMREAIRRGELRIRAEALSPGALAVIQACLSPNPASRPPLQELHEKLAGLERELRAADYQSAWTSVALSSAVYDSIIQREADDEQPAGGVAV